jgi:hypothetical protein
MNHHEIIRKDSFVRIDVFGEENKTDFPAGSKGAALFAQMKTIAQNLNRKAADQSSAKGDSRLGFFSKGTARENMRGLMTLIADTVAGGAAYDVPGLETKFRVPINRKDNDLLAAARSFVKDIGPHEALLIEWGLDEDFLEQLAESVGDFERSLTAAGTAVGEQVGTTAGIGEEVREGMIVRRQLDVIVRNQYKNNPGKLAAWQSAWHIGYPKRKNNQPGGNPPVA